MNVKIVIVKPVVRSRPPICPWVIDVGEAPRRAVGRQRTVLGPRGSPELPRGAAASAVPRPDDPVADDSSHVLLGPVAARRTRRGRRAPAVTTPRSSAESCRRRVLAARWPARPRAGRARVEPATFVAGVAQPRSRGARCRPPSRIAALLERASLLRLDRDCRHRARARRARRPSTDGRTLAAHAAAPASRSTTARRSTRRPSSALITRRCTTGRRIGPPPGLRDVERVEVGDALTSHRARLGAPSAAARRRSRASMSAAARRRGLRGGSVHALAAENPARIDRWRLRGLLPRGARRSTGSSCARSDSPRTAWAALLRGEIGFLYEVAPESVPFVESSPDVQVRRLPASVRLRGRLQPARHRCSRGRACGGRCRWRSIGSAMVRRVLDGRGRVRAPTPCGRCTGRSTAPSRRRGFDPARARRELEAAGLPFERRPRRAAAHRRGCRVHVPRARRHPACSRGWRSPCSATCSTSASTCSSRPVPLAVLAQRLAAGDFDAYLLDMNALRPELDVLALAFATRRRPFIDAGADARRRRARCVSGAPPTRTGLRAAVAELRRAFARGPARALPLLGRGDARDEPRVRAATRSAIATSCCRCRSGSPPQRLGDHAPLPPLRARRRRCRPRAAAGVRRRLAQRAAARAPAAPSGEGIVNLTERTAEQLDDVGGPHDRAGWRRSRPSSTARRLERWQQERAVRNWVLRVPGVPLADALRRDGRAAASSSSAHAGALHVAGRSIAPGRTACGSLAAHHRRRPAAPMSTSLRRSRTRAARRETLVGHAEPRADLAGRRPAARRRARLRDAGRRATAASSRTAIPTSKARHRARRCRSRRTRSRSRRAGGARAPAGAGGVRRRRRRAAARRRRARRDVAAGC